MRMVGVGNHGHGLTPDVGASTRVELGSPFRRGRHVHRRGFTSCQHFLFAQQPTAMKWATW